MVRALPLEVELLKVWRSDVPSVERVLGVELAGRVIPSLERAEVEL